MRYLIANNLLDMKKIHEPGLLKREPKTGKAIWSAKSKTKPKYKPRRK